MLRKLYGWYKRRTGYLPKPWLAVVSQWCGGFSDKRVLDVGCDSFGALISQIDRSYRPREIVGLNPAIQARQFSPTCRLEKGDIRGTAFADSCFDVIVSSSAFEHVHDFDKALQEMFRILQPGGIVFSAFGPIWSCSYGHHLWVWHRGKRYNYWNVILPPFCHLLMSEQEVLGILQATHHPDLARAMAHFIFHSDEQNRWFFEDYENAVRQSPFEVLVFMGYTTPALEPKYQGAITPALLESLHQKYPKNRNFMYEGITMLLRKPRS
jgi:SAM-dependent methyltransferase